MEENTNLTTEQTANQQDAFLAGWDEEDSFVRDEADRADDAAGDSASEQNEAEAEGAEDAQKTESEGANAEAQTKAEDVSGAESQTESVQELPKWVLKHMGEEKVFGVEDVTPELLQKGLDYDRVRGKYDESKPVMEMFTEFAKKANMTVPEYVKYIRAEAKKASGMSEDEAKRAIDLEDREAAVSAKEAEQQESVKAKETNEAKIRQDLADFANAFPEVYEQAKSDLNVIPQSVWDSVKGGRMSLTAAYARYAIDKANESAKSAKAEAQTAEQNKKNAERSSGSMKTAGSTTASKDPFLAGFTD